VASASTPAFSGASLGWLTALVTPAQRRSELLLTADGGRTWRPVTPPDAIDVRVPCGGGPVTVVARIHLHVYQDTLREPWPPDGLGQTAGCRYRLHGQGADTLVVEATPAERGRTYTLGDLFDVWGIPDAGYASPVRSAAVPAVRIEVNGRPLAAGEDARAVPLRDGTDIVIRVTSARTAPQVTPPG